MRKPKPTLTFDWLSATHAITRVVGGIESIEHRQYPDRPVEQTPVRIQWDGRGWRGEGWCVITQPFSHHGRRYSWHATGAAAQDYAIKYFESNFRIKGD